MQLIAIVGGDTKPMVHDGLWRNKRDKLQENLTTVAITELWADLQQVLYKCQRPRHIDATLYRFQNTSNIFVTSWLSQLRIAIDSCTWAVQICSAAIVWKVQLKSDVRRLKWPACVEQTASTMETWQEMYNSTCVHRCILASHKMYDWQMEFTDVSLIMSSQDAHHIELR